MSQQYQFSGEVVVSDLSFSVQVRFDTLCFDSIKEKSYSTRRYWVIDGCICEMFASSRISNILINVGSMC